MRFTVWQALLGVAVALVAAPMVLHAEESSPLLGDLYVAAPLGVNAFAQVDDLMALNAEGIGRRGFSADLSNSSSDTTADSSPAVQTLDATVPAAEGSWILGAFGAVFVMGLGITFAGIYWSGPRGLTRASW
jgi:hypothetical protein